MYSLTYWHTRTTRSPSSFTTPAAHRPVLDSDWLDGCAASANEITAVICGYLDVYEKDKEGERKKERERERGRERGREIEGGREGGGCLLSLSHREERRHHTSERINF